MVSYASQVPWNSRAFLRVWDRKTTVSRQGNVEGLCQRAIQSVRGRTAQQPTQAVLRARVSSKEQEEEGFSLPAQIRPGA
jgi:hypothetical protein